MDAKSVITNKTKLVALTHVSNVLGTVNDVAAVVRTAHEKGALVLVDGAQAVPHMAVDVRALDADFYVFSGHKMLGPTGIGVLYARRALLEKMSPFLYGGDMISRVTYDGAEWNELPWKFEAGTPNIAGGVGLTAAIDYLEKVGMEKIRAHEERLVEYAIKQLTRVEGVTIFGNPRKRGGVVSFNVEGIHPHDLASILDDEQIAVRAGHHCAQPLMGHMGIGSCARASFYLYNEKGDVDALVAAIKKAKKVMKV